MSTHRSDKWFGRSDSINGSTGAPCLVTISEVVRSRSVRVGHPLAVALLSTLLIGGSAVAAKPLTSANSIPFEFAASSTETFTGTNCGATATVTKRLPAGAMGIKVAKPKLGERDKGGGTKVTAVKVAGTVVAVTVLADGPSICDPARTGVPVGEPVNWVATYDVRAEYKRRVQATIRIFYESYIFGAKWELRPRTIHDYRRGGGELGERVTDIKWKQFGGKTAVGYGTLRLNYCRRGDNCPENGKRVRLVASKPGYCKDSGKIEYLRLFGYVSRFPGPRVNLEIECSP